MTNAYLFKLIDLDSPLKQSYWNSYHCASAIEHTEEEGISKLTSKYCNNRWCMVCNRIRTAKLIAGYSPVLEEMTEKYFLTLTVPNVAGDQLAGKLEEMYNTVRAINKDARGYYKLKFKGIRKVECTYNLHRNDYHPHFHMILDNKQASEHFLKQWLKRYPDANSKGQDLRKADNNSVKELFKYFTKITTKLDDEGAKTVDAKSLDTIFQAMRGKRIFQAMGIKKHVSEDIEELQSETYKNIPPQQTTYIWNNQDWFCIKTGQALTDYQPSENVQKLVNSALKIPESQFIQDFDQAYKANEEKIKQELTQDYQYRNGKKFPKQESFSPG